MRYVLSQSVKEGLVDRAHKWPGTHCAEAFYYDKPLLCDGDGPIPIFRRWCTQFYTWPEEQQAAE